MLHGCTIRENSLIGIGAIVLNRAVVGKNCLVGAGALVPEGKVIPDGSLVLGVRQGGAQPHARGDRDEHLDRRALRRARRAATARASKPDRMTARAATAARSLVWALLLAYASLYPFFPLRLAAPRRAARASSRPRYFDPLRHRLQRASPTCRWARSRASTSAPRATGARAIAARRARSAPRSASRWRSLQLFVPNRVAPSVDVAANAAGALVGALAVRRARCYSLVTRPTGRSCASDLDHPGRLGRRGPGAADAVAHRAAQSRAAVLRRGQHRRQRGAAVGDRVRCSGRAVAMAICGFGLFVSVLLKRARGALRVTVVLLTSALWLKFATAALMLQPHFTADG